MTISGQFVTQTVLMYKKYLKLFGTIFPCIFQRQIHCESEYSVIIFFKYPSIILVLVIQSFFCHLPFAKLGDIKTYFFICHKNFTWLISSEVLMIEH